MLQNKIKSRPTFVKMDDNCDVATLLKDIKIISNKMEDNISTYNALHEVKAKLFCYQQLGNETLADHMRNFKNLCNSIEYNGGDVFFYREIVKAEIRSDPTEDVGTVSGDEYRTRVTDKAKAVVFLKCASRKTYGKLLSSTREQYSFKIGVYPKNVSDAYEMLSAHTPHESTQGRNKKGNKTNNNNAVVDGVRSGNEENSNSQATETGTSYLQSSAVPGTDGRIIAHIKCYNCGKKGYYADNCPNSSTVDEQHTQMNRQSDNIPEESVQYDSEEQHLQTSECQPHNDVVHFSWTLVQKVKGQNYTDTEILLDIGSTFWCSKILTWS